jgi:hypothetical protein
MLKYTILLLMLLTASLKSFAQFTGGDADGFSAGLLTQSSCPPIVSNFVFYGGNDDGSSIAIVTQGGCVPIVANFAFYGGVADGSSNGYLEQINCGQLTTDFIFYGGNNDGSSVSSLTQSGCTPIVANFVFYGGSSDGYDTGSLTQSGCTPVVANFAFYGGNSDGNDTGSLTQSGCTPVVANFAFYGGNADGFSTTLLTQSGCTPVVADFVFYGGNADGFAFVAINSSGTPSSSPTLCIGTPATPITHATTGATGISNSGVSGANGLPAGMSATWASNTITISGTPTVAGTFNYSIPLIVSCGSLNATGRITVTPALVGGTVAGSATVCTGSNLTTLTLSGHTAGAISRWESSIDNFATAGTPIANTTTTLTVSNLIVTTSYRAVIGNSTCNSINSSIATITVSTTSLGGTVAGSATVCSGTNSTTLTLSGHTGTIVRWESSINNFATAGTPIANTTTTLTATNLTATTNYRAVLTSGSCTAASDSATVTVISSVGGTVAGSTTVCTGTNSTILTLSGHTGDITRWESSPSSTFASSVTSIANTTTTLTATDLTVTTYYRAVVTNSTCSPANSAIATVTVSPASVGGTVAGSTTVCTGTNSTTLTLSGHTGAITRWESSLNNFATAGTPIANTTTTLTATNLTATTYYRAVLTSGPCSSANSAIATVTVGPISVGGTVAGSATVCTGTNSTTLTLSGFTGAITRWESSPSSTFASAVTSIANTTTTLTATDLTATTYYRAVITNSPCGPVNSAIATVTVSPASVGGTVAGSATVCSGTNSTTLTLSGHTGTVTRWESSLNNFATAGTNIANTTTTLVATNLTATTYYRAVLTSGPCSATSSAVATVTVSPLSIGGIVAGSTTVCTGTNSTTLTLSGHTGAITRWESSTSSTFASGVTPIANTTTTLTVTDLTATTYYRAVLTSSPCSAANSSIATVTVSPIPVGGTVAGSDTVCSGNNLTTLTLSGHSGAITRWESSLDNFATAGTPIANTIFSLNVNNITATTYYRAVITNAGCASVYSTTAIITVSPTSVGGSVAGSATVCNGNNTTTLTLSGQTGAVIRWESSFNNFATAGTPIANTTTTLTVTNLTTTTYYRARVASSPCSSVNSASATLTVIASVGGTISGNATVCTGTNSTTLTLSGYTGAIINWESSLDNFVTAGTPIANTTTTLTATNLTATTSYRALLTNGTCNSVYSARATVTVSPTSVGGTIAGSATVCTGTNSTTLTLSGHTGAITRWESSINNFATAGTPIANTTTTLTATNLTTTTYYRAVLTSSPCSAANSAIATVTVSPASVGGTVSGGATVCTGTNSTTLTLSGHTGAIIRWESSLNNFATAGTPIANTSTTLIATDLTATTFYRAVLTSSPCSAANSAVATVTVSPASVGGTISGSSSVCTGTTIILTLGGHTGAITRWESSLNNFATAGTPIANTTTTLTATLTTTTYYRAVVTSGACSSVNSAVATVIVSPVSVGGSATATPATICTGNSTTILLTGNTGSTIQWQQSANGSTGWATVTGGSGGTTATYTTPNLTSTTYYRAVVTSGGCSSANSTIATITVNGPTGQPTLGSLVQPTCAALIGSFTITNYNASYTYTASPSTGVVISGANVAAPAGTYTISASFAGCPSPASASVTLNALPTNTWNGSSWSLGSNPTSSQIVVFAGDYTSSTDLLGCSCIVNSGNITINSGNTLTITNAVTVTLGTLIFENGASLVQTNDASINTGTIIYKRNSSPLKQYDFTYWSSPVANTPLSQLATSSVFYSFSPTINNWVNESAATIMAPGVGYIARAPNNLTYNPTQVVETVFSGVPNNGVISTSIIKSTGTYNLLGNPYPSALDIDLFLIDPSNAGVVNGTIYLWTHNTAITNNVYTSNDYAKYNFTGGVRTATSAITGGFLPTGKIASGQGFFIEANSSLANGTYTATYRNAMRIASNNSQFFRTTDASNSDSSISSSLEKHRIWLSLSSALGSYNEMLLGYVENATNDFDTLFDGKTLAVGNPVSLFTTVGTDDLSIQGRALPFNGSEIIPLGYSTTVNGQLTVNLENYDGLFSNQEVYLLDKYLNICHNIKSGVYNFTTTNGTFRDRFELRFTNTTLNTNTPSFDSSLILVTNDKKLSIFSGTYTITKVEVFDLLGKKLYHDDKLNTNNHHVELPIATQAIIVKITSDDRVTVKKAMIN